MECGVLIQTLEELEYNLSILYKLNYTWVVTEDPFNPMFKQIEEVVAGCESLNNKDVKKDVIDFKKIRIDFLDHCEFLIGPPIYGPEYKNDEFSLALIYITSGNKLRYVVINYYKDFKKTNEKYKIMNVLDLLIGKKMIIMTDMKVEVELEIKEVTEKRHSRQITPDTPENDWWGETENWTTYTVNFTNGAKKEFSSINEIKVI